MKITQKDINNFNRRIEPSFNEDYNKAKGIYSMATYSFLRRIQQTDSGLMREPISMKIVKKWRDYI